MYIYVYVIYIYMYIYMYMYIHVYVQAYMKKNKGDTSQLGPPERIAIMLASLPLVRDWLGAMLFREEFVVREQEISQKMQLALTCAAAVRTSEAVKEV